MKVRNLHWKRMIFGVVLTLLLGVSGVTKAEDPNFLEGSLLYYVIEPMVSVGVAGHYLGTAAYGTLTIPETVTHDGITYSVVSVGGFQGSPNLTGNIVIPNSVTEIRDYAFSDCPNLSGELTIPASVTHIGEGAFIRTGFSTVNFNATECNYMGDNGSSFYGCPNLTTLNIGEGVQYIPDYAFFCGYQTQGSFTGELTIPASVTYIGNKAFSYTGFSTVNFNATECNYMGDNGSSFYSCPNLTTLNIGEGVQFIPYHAFSDCPNLSGELTIPASVTHIGEGAFINTGFSTVNFNATECTYMGVEYEPPFSGCSSLTTLNIGEGVQYIPDNAFLGCITLSGELSIPASVNYIGDASFMDCIGFTGSLVIPDAVTFIGNQAFDGCNGFDGTLTLGNSLQSIGDYAFRNCNNFTGELTIPNSLQSIGNQAFYDCNNFTGDLTIPNSVENIGYGAFRSNAYTGVLTIGTGITSIGDGAFAYTGFSEVHYNATNCLDNNEESFFPNCPNLTTLVVGNNVQNIPKVAFYNCSTFTGTLILPNSLISIGDQAFYNCYGFEGIVMGNSVEIIGYEAFRNCGGLRGELTLPETLLSVGPSAFAGCNEISTVNYNAVNCETMGNASHNVFADCLSLAHIRIGANVESIPNYAFKPCFLVTDMSVAAEVPPTIGPSTFGTVSRSIPVSVPYGSGEAYRTAPYWEEFFHITEDYSPNSYTYHWNVNIHQFEANMTVTGIIQIEGVEQSVPYLEIGAFCNGECRGRQLLTYYPEVDRYLVFLMLYGETGDIFNFKLYNHETNEESIAGCVSVVTFEPNAIVGTFEEPFVFNFTNMQLTQFYQGWNWWSTYIEQEGVDGLTMLEEGLGSNGYQIKSQTDFVTNYGTMWFGMLSSINNEETYMVNNSADCVVAMPGMPATPSDHPITISNGWNWIGYPCTNTMSVSEAFTGLESTNGDQVKSQADYAMYFNGIWIGQLQSIAPGTGLMYMSNNATPTTLVYPDGGRNMQAPAMPKATHWTNDIHAYPHNMTVMSVVELDDVELTSDNYELAAFANGECRGSAKLTYVEPLNRYVAFLTISGNEAVELGFRLYDAETGTEYYDAEERLNFVTNVIVGEPDDLYVVHFRGTTGINELANSVQIYPNPVSCGERFSINIADEAKSPVRVEIVNALGVETLRATSEQTPAMVTAPSAAGVYTLRITVEGKGTAVCKLLVR